MLRALLLSVLVVFVIGCGNAITPSPSASPSSASPSSTAVVLAPASPAPTPEAFAVVSIETRGGHCRTGPCGRLVNIEGDGRIHEVIPTDRVTGRVPKELLEALRIEVEKANYPLLQSRPFTGECPTAYDGQETVYTFHVSSGDEELASCTVEIDLNHPLMQAVAAATALETP